MYGTIFIGAIAILWVFDKLRVIPPLRRRYTSMGFASALFVLSMFAGSYLSGTSSPTDSACNPNYFPCIPANSEDLDCNEVKWRVEVTGTDVFNLDRDKDGFGCEWNPVFTPDETISE
jgi:hypothetical protein